MRRVHRPSAGLLIVCLCLLAPAAPAAGASKKVGASKKAGARELMAAFKKGEALKKQGKNAQAIVPYRRALRLSTRLYGEDHTNTATLMNNLALLYQATGKHAK